MTELQLLVDIRSLSGYEAQGGGQLLARAGDVVDFLSDEGDYVIAQTKSGSVCFPLETEEYMVIQDGTEQETAQAADAIYLSRGKYVRHEIDVTRALQVGFYVPSDRFKNMDEMTAVFFADNMNLVATTGPAHDAESEAYAKLFAASIGFAGVKAELIAVLRTAEVVLSEKWKAESFSFKPHDQPIAIERPDIFAKVKDQYQMDCYPTAVALVAVRAVLEKYGKP
jgi:hypothetical protein